jgi:4-amino-4-deoxy-L-arabinose transferase-like glycosyltransferase
MGKNRIVIEPELKDASRWWSKEDLLLIVLIAAFFFLPGLGQICLFDRDEPRFSEATREMLQSHDYIVPHFNGDLRPDKPPFLYWMMSLTYRMVGDNEFGARLPSALFGTLTLIAVYLIAGFRFGRVTGILAAVMLGSCTLFIVESRLATADATMIFFTTVALGCAWRAWEIGSPGDRTADGHRIIPKARYLVHAGGDDMLDHVQPAHVRQPMSWWTVRLFWVALACGTLTKGVPLLFVLLPMIVLSIATGAVAREWKQWKTQSAAERLYHLPAFVMHGVIRGNWGWWRNLRPATGFPMLVLLTGWWFGLAGWATDWDIVKQMIGHHVLDRAREGLEGHKQWPGFYITAVWATFWPWSFLLIPCAYHTVRRMLGRTAIAIDPKPYQFMAAWIVPSWIVYEFIQTKLVHYVLPLYIPLIILCADMLVQSWNRLTDVLTPKWFRAAMWVWLLVWLSLAGALLAYFWIALPVYFWQSVPLAAALAAAGVAGAIAWNRPAWPFVTALAYGMALMIGGTGLVPALQELRISERASAILSNYYYMGDEVGAAGYEEPTLIFYTGQWMEKKPGQLRMLDFGSEGKTYLPGPTLELMDLYQRKGHSSRVPTKFAMVLDQANFDALGPRGHHMEVATLRGFPTLDFKPLLHLQPIRIVPPRIVHVISNEPPPPPPATRAASGPSQ